MVTVDYGSGSPQEAAAELAYLEGSTTDNTTIGTGIDGTTAPANGKASTGARSAIGPACAAASPLGTDDGLNFLRIDHPAPITNVKYWEIGNENTAVGRSIITAPPVPAESAPAPQHDPTTYAAFAEQFATLAAEIVSTAGLPAISIGIDSGDPTGSATTTGRRMF